MQPEDKPMQQQSIDMLYREAVELADRARAWFDGPGVAWRAALPASGQAAVAIESLGTTARLMAVMAWLLDPAHLVAKSANCSGVAIVAVDKDLPSGSPLIGTPGGLIAAAARRLATNVAALAQASEPEAVSSESAPKAELLLLADEGLWRA